jgi:tRNA nucleotidyltransferase (CCA-adding enzyme)
MDQPARVGEELPSGGRLLAHLGQLSGGGERLLAVASPATFLVGGAVRDLLLGRAPRELDVVVEGEHRARALVAALGAADTRGPSGVPVAHASVAAPGASTAQPASDRRGTSAAQRTPNAQPPPAPVEHPRFGTATLALPGGVRVDVALARRERYPAPGALPEVEPAPLAEDLRRRDFTVNALALALAGPHAGELQGLPHSLEDLRAGRLRVLHEDSFRDDPTRLLRLARYRARLGFEIEPHTAALAAEALAGGALDTVSGARLGAELRLALHEPEPLAALAELERLGVLRALHPRLRFERALAWRALELLGAGASEWREEQRPPIPAQETRRGGICAGRADDETDRPDLLMLAALLLPLALRAGDDPRAEIAALLDRLEFPAGDRDRVAAAAAATPTLVDELPRAASCSELRAVALPVPAEGVALAGAVSEPAAAAARRWLGDVRHVRLAIGGRDLLAAGVLEGPEIGRRLEAVLKLRLDGELADGSNAELAAALEAPIDE